MENRNQFLIVLAGLGIVLLAAYLIVSGLTRGSDTSVALATPTPRPSGTPASTFTPTPTDTPFVFLTPTPVPPTVTPTALPPTATATPANTATSTPAPVVRIPTRTPTPIPTATPVVVSYPFRIESGPMVDPSFLCKNQYMLHGFVRDAQGQAIPGTRIRYVQQIPTVRELTATTEAGTKAGFDYELTLGINANEWDIFLVDAGDNPLSPSVRLVTTGFESGNCWWQLNWKHN